jgi:hypothetical protein
MSEAEALAINVMVLRGKLERALQCRYAAEAKDRALIDVADAIGDPGVSDLVGRILDRKDDAR